MTCTFRKCIGEALCSPPRALGSVSGLWVFWTGGFVPQSLQGSDR